MKLLDAEIPAAGSRCDRLNQEDYLKLLDLRRIYGREINIIGVKPALIALAFVRIHDMQVVGWSEKIAKQIRVGIRSHWKSWMRNNAMKT